MGAAVAQDGVLAVVREAGRHAGEGQRRLEQGLAQVLALGIVMLRPVLAVTEQIGLVGGTRVGEVGGQHAAIALVLAVTVALFHQHLETVAGLQVADEVDLRAEQAAQGKGQLRALADVGHGLEEVVVDGGFHLGEGGHIFDGLHAGHGLFRPFHHQTAAGVDLVLEALELAGSRIHHDGVGLAGTEGPHGEDLPGGAHIGVGSGRRVAFDDLADGIALFHRAVHHGLAVDDLGPFGQRHRGLGILIRRCRFRGGGFGSVGGFCLPGIFRPGRRGRRLPIPGRGLGGLLRHGLGGSRICILRAPGQVGYAQLPGQQAKKDHEDEKDCKSCFLHAVHSKQYGI